MSAQSLAESQDLSGPGVSNEPTYELEDPAEAWIQLVQATRILQVRARQHAVQAMVLKARNSHWDLKKWNDFAAGYDSPDMGGDADEGGTYAECGDAGFDPKNARTRVTARLDCFRCGRPIQYCACYRATADARCPTCGQLWNNCSCTITS